MINLVAHLSVIACFYRMITKEIAGIYIRNDHE
jgi:hypothetical protein